MTFFGKGVLIEKDGEDSEYVYIILEGRVDIIKYKALINTNLLFANLAPGEVFGDTAIQRKIEDPLKFLRKDHSLMKTASERTQLMCIERNEFVCALF